MSKAAAIRDSGATLAKSSRRFPMGAMGMKEGASMTPSGRAPPA